MKVVDVNLKGAFFVTKYALAALRATKGNIVNIASISCARRALPSHAGLPSSCMPCFETARSSKPRKGIT